ncbi:ABC transporter ATP-binding protein [Pseudorhodoferax sp. Leaf274]|uniref:ABC transporter ATP-binding protein n=1 Tax=Pseudorhodoferax sp. Leaf274 TaxID=1736318 RepID=UPI0007023EEA|nr:ABC transporter ATP-binding protein [Pseudorhodoferax sp. Leaf274]KQP46183.1 sugar ABC transporter ATP-binding protein [Pseudorhodoferax sp. Leaf274]
MSSEFSVQVDGLGKCYQVYELPRDRLKQFIVPRLRRMLGRPSASPYYREFWALKNASFAVQKGETVGIIGRNGSGKSTLLQMICGTLTPSRGSVRTSGRIAALLELGSGFNPEFTGRENVYLNGAVLGLRKDEIDARFDDIVAFADIGEFISQPVKNYSSGMVVRLAFAVQAQSNPDILIVDEALAVGDAKFQAKCFAHLKKLKAQGTSILLVSHSTEQIATHCDRAVFLKSGDVVAIGKPRDVINLYLDDMFGVERVGDVEAAALPTEDVAEQSYGLSVTDDRFHLHPTYNAHEYRWGDGGALLLDHCMQEGGRADVGAVHSGAGVQLRLSIRFISHIVRPIVGFTIKTKEGVTLYNTNSELQRCGSIGGSGDAGHALGVAISFLASFAPGDYFISIGVASRQPNGDVVPHDRRYDSILLTVLAAEHQAFSGIFDVGAQMQSEFHGAAAGGVVAKGGADAAA